MDTNREDIGIAIRSALIDKGTKQKFSLFVLIILSIIFIFIFFLFPKQKSQRVYIHTAIIAKRAKINKMSKKNKSVKKTIKAKIKNFFLFYQAL